MVSPNFMYAHHREISLTAALLWVRRGEMLSRCLVRVVIPQLPGCWLLAVCPMKYVAGTVTDWRHAQHHQPPPAPGQKTRCSREMLYLQTYRQIWGG